jgi:isopentenyl-diphosphate delta-isomerase
MSETHVDSADAAQLLVLVDTDDNVVGYERKDRCHDGAGILHRAFSAYLFTADNRLLIQQRSARKRLWPLFWSNSCCGHPNPEEEMQLAAQRRVCEELGFVVPLEFAFKYRYEAGFAPAGSENEYCYVYVGVLDSLPNVNEAEVADWRLVHADELDRAIERRADGFTPWFLIGWQRLRAEGRGRVFAAGME